MEITKKFYKNKRIFVTGHTGFKGAWLTLWLNMLGAKVYGYSLEPQSEPNIFEACKVEDKCTSFIGDIRDYDLLKEKIEEFDPHIIFHMAAQALVRDSYEDPIDTFSTNLMGTVNVLNCARKVKSLKSIVVVTSDKCYENNETGKPFKETDPMGGKDPYSASKGCAELAAFSYSRSFFDKNEQATVASVRAGNVIGGGDWSKDRLIPDIVRSVNSEKEITLRNPKSVRPWQHVLEPLGGYLLIGRKTFEEGKIFEGGWNFGPDKADELCVDEIVVKIITIWNKKIPVICKDTPQKEAGILRLSIEKVKDKLSWKPVLNITTALEMTVNWYKQYYEDKEKILDFTEKQISNYMSKNDE